MKLENQLHLARLERILEADKEDVNEKSRKMALADFLRVANEYFEVEGGLDFHTERSKNGVEVSLRFRATRVKNCISLE